MHSDGDCDALSWWNVNEPNDWGSGEDCAHIRSSASSIYVLLNDIPCTYTGVDYFICDAPSSSVGPSQEPTMEPTEEPIGFDTTEEDALTPLQELGWTPSYPLGECQGDCDYDSHCDAGLLCYHDDVPPGCYGSPSDGLYDYCYDPNWSSPSTPTTGPTTTFPSLEPTEDPIAFTTTEDDGDETVLLSKPGSFQPNGEYIGTIELHENMHYEMDIEIHSFRSETTQAWTLNKGILDCYNGTDHQHYYPRIQMHSTSSSSDGFWIIFGTARDWTGEGLVEGTTHHLELDITRDTYTVTQDGVTKSESYPGHPNGRRFDCYAWDTGAYYANVTVSNLLITTTGMVITLRFYHQMIIIIAFFVF